MEETLQHIVNITAEAIEDYENSLGCMNVVLPSGTTIKTDIKNQCETFIESNQRYQYKRYFKLKYLDETYNKEIYLFFRKKEIVQENKQMWNLVGICESKYWTEELEDSGQIKVWLDTKTEDLPDIDWVVELNRKTIINLLEEIQFEGGYDAYINTRKKLTEKLSRIQSTDKTIELKPNRIKSTIKRMYISTRATTIITGYLNRVLGYWQERNNQEDLSARSFPGKVCQKKLYIQE